MIAVIGGCIPDPKPYIEKDLPNVVKGPEKRPTKSITNFSSAMRCMDGLLMDHGVYDISMLAEDLKDNTGNVRAGARDMLISAISDMTRRSHAVRLVAYGSDSGNLVSWLASAQKQSVYAAVPQYDIRGSISQSDKKVVGGSSELGGNISVGESTSFGAGGAATAGADVLALDLSVMRTSDLSVIPGVISKNQIIIFKTGSGAEANAGFGTVPKFGLNFKMSVVRSEGDAQALRNLIELAAIELVGRLTNTPYWSCLEADPKQEEIQNEIYDWYYNLKADQKVVKYFQSQLRNRRFYNGPIDNVYNAPLTEAVKAYQQGIGVAATGNINYDFFNAFLNNPTPTPPANLLATRTLNIEAKPPALSINFANTNKTAIAKGEEFQIEIKSNQNMHVACYFKSENGKIQRFFPNRFTTDSLVTASSPLQLPGNMPFKLFASKAGNSEQLACFASRDPIMNKLPVDIKGIDFEDLTVDSLDEIKSTFKQAMGTPIGESYFDIKIN